ncbi:hypothetical protein [uncultured Phenylobacterium sp.]|uniref:hypothetical protein n=1 Tax=uncultured Phenylobacterium sp. TaxID=349273 RepID=UPI0025E93C52|nr:hypothetical protein [uncultured Phenylobacterium sp.]
MIKPLVRGLETNLVLATNRLLQLRSGEAHTFNTAVTWDLGSVMDGATPATTTSPAPATLSWSRKGHSMQGSG